MVADWTDEEIWALRRGGHDPQKVYAAYHAAVRHTGQPTVILAKTIKGYGMGVAGEGRNITHQQKAMNEEARLAIRDRLGLHLTDEEATGAFFHRPDESSPELRYLMERRAELGGSLPARHADSRAAADAGAVHERARGKRRARELDDDGVRPGPQLARARQGARPARRADRPRRVAHVRDGGDVPPARDLLAGRPALPARGRRATSCSTTRTSTARSSRRGSTSPAPSRRGSPPRPSYANHGVTMIPFYIFYSMFGFQRVGDLAWAAGDSRARGFLIGGTSGRTTLNGEGLQHEDGHSHLLAADDPQLPCVRPDLRLRARRDRARRAPADVSASRRTSSTT